MSDTLVKFKTGTVEDLASKKVVDGVEYPSIPLESGSVYFAVDTANSNGKIVYDYPLVRTGLSNWNSTTSYAKDAEVIYNGKYYKSFVANNIGHVPYGAANSYNYWREIVTRVVMGSSYGLKIENGNLILVRDGQNTSVTLPDNDTWQVNTKSQGGYVTAGSGQANKVWKTDGSGNPAWRDDDNNTYSTATNANLGLVKPWYSHTKASTGPATGSNATAVEVNALSSTEERYYAIESDSNGRLFVNVPWANDNTWQANTKSQGGYVASPNGETNKIWMTNSTDGTPSWTAIGDVLKVGDAMVFKGVIAGTATSPGAFTKAANCGDTYRVSTAGYVNGQRVEAGDLFICTADGTVAATSSNYSTVQNTWTIAQTNLDGAVIGPSSVSTGNFAQFDGGSGKLINDSGYSPDSFSLVGHDHNIGLEKTGTSVINLTANTTYTLTAGGQSIAFKTPADNNTKYTAMPVAEMQAGEAGTSRSITAANLKAAFLGDSTDTNSIFATGSTNGTISVYDTDVAVKGLGSAAYTNSDAYATSGHTHPYLPLAGGTMTGVLKAYANQYTDDYTTCGINMQNSDIVGLNSIYTVDSADNAGEGIHFYRDSTHVDTLWINGGDILFVPNRVLGTGTTKANSQKVGRFTANPTSGQVVITDGTTGGMKSSGYTIAKSVPSDAKFTDTDTKQNITLKTTTKGFITAVETTPTGTAAAQPGIADTGVYLTTTAGQINAKTYKVDEAVTFQYNSTTKSLDFIFA